MPSEAISLALAASIYPPALAVVIALGRGAQVRLRVVLLVAGAFCTVLVTGLLMLLLFNEAGVTSGQARSAGSGLYIAAGVVLLWLSLRLRKPAPASSAKKSGPSRTDRYLQSTRLVFVLGVVLYVVPSPIYLALVKEIANANASTAQELLYLVQALLIMLWMIEIPMLMLLAFPARASRVLEDVNAWFVRNGRIAASVVAAVAGVISSGWRWLNCSEPAQLAGAPGAGSSWLSASSCSSVICSATAGWLEVMWRRPSASSSRSVSPRTIVPHSQTITRAISG